ncbi:MAG: hypothetical protein WCD11_10535, partial [Solirubrobacteraceae bacterium]
MTNPVGPATSAIAFAGGTLDRAEQLRSNDEAERLRRLDTSRALLVGPGQEVAIGADQALLRVPLAELPDEAELTFLGLDRSGAAVFAYHAAVEGPKEGEFVGLRGLAAELEAAEG